MSKKANKKRRHYKTKGITVIDEVEEWTQEKAEKWKNRKLKLKLH